ncbi:hypothetical protein I4U23_006296 [Adineta vaga]|nr:hypothetical protein I4U23_006296 [Adineta vaga]
MYNYCSISKKSLIPIRKWLFEAGDGPSTSYHISSLKHNNHHNRQNSYCNKISKRKKSQSIPLRIIDWFYEFVKNIFTIHDEYSQQQTSNSAIVSIIKSDQLTPKSLSVFGSQRMLIDTTNDSNLNLIYRSKSTQTYYNKQQSIVSPFDCFSMQDRRILPLAVLSSSLPFDNQSPAVSFHPHSSLSTYNQSNHSIQYNPSDILFAENTCQLIKQAWLS